MDCLDNAHDGRCADGDAPPASRCAIRTLPWIEPTIHTGVAQRSIIARRSDRPGYGVLPEISHRKIEPVRNVGEIVGNVRRSRDQTVSIERIAQESMLTGIASIVVARRGHEADRYLRQLGEQASLLAALP